MTDQLLRNKVVAITGAGRGLGTAFAVHAAEAGACVLVTARHSAAAETVARQIQDSGGQATGIGIDVTKPEDAELLVTACLDHYGGLDGVVNNAGIEIVGPSWENDVEELVTMIEVNLIGTLRVGLAALRHMTTLERGSIVNMTSGAQMGLKGLAVYGATKGAIASLTHGWALDASPYGVRVNAVSPLASTDMYRHNLRADGHSEHETERRLSRIPTAADNAPLVTYLLSDEARSISGQGIRFDARGISVVSHPAIAGFPRQLDRPVLLGDVASALDDLAPHMMPLGMKTVSGGHFDVLASSL